MKNTIATLGAGLARVGTFFFATKKRNNQLAKQWLYRCNIAARQQKIIDILLHGNHIKDNTEGRMNVVAIFLAVVMPSINDHKLRQAIMNGMISEIEDSYRVEGVHDMVVGKRVKALAAKLYARLKRYHAVFMTHDKKKLVELLEFYFGIGQEKNYKKLADYFIDCEKYLKHKAGTADIPPIN
ncbi:MAG: ubiquinol-cytochrome C chaperone family protein [Hydrotalea sp.]|nr:ubiquinol-cytochrome C chaperone family protein [Hydrotalea sp.]